jgi:D-psicose/D-tagatose/L-ribulose 3-epimerase
VQVGYDGDVVLESFAPAVTSIAAAVCLWRPVAPDQDTIVREGLAFLRRLVEAPRPNG